MRRARRGFTLLEMLAVMGIMLILVGLAVIGFEQLDRSASGKQTRAMLNDCTAMLNEFEAEGGAQGLSSLGTGGPEPTTGFPYPSGAGGPLGGSATGEVTNVVTSNTTYGRYGYAVENTWYVMANLMRIPQVKAMVDKLPATRILTTTNNGVVVPWSPGNRPSTVSASAGVVLLDGWGNPIIFVPSNGIYVWLKGQPSAKLIQSPDALPFFASAGPDGDFGADYNPNAPLTNYTTSDSWTSPTMGTTRTPMGDDNIYSFENGQ